MPPVAAVYVKTSVLPVEPWATDVVGVPLVPAPFAESTAIDGCAASTVSGPVPFDFSFTVHVWLPVATEAVAPGPPPLLTPYVITTFWPPERVNPETVIVWPETATVPT